MLGGSDAPMCAARNVGGRRRAPGGTASRSRPGVGAVGRETKGSPGPGRAASPRGSRDAPMAHSPSNVLATKDRRGWLDDEPDAGTITVLLRNASLLRNTGLPRNASLPRTPASPETPASSESPSS